MSIWKIGADDVSDETQAFKDKIASKGRLDVPRRYRSSFTLSIDSQIAAHQDCIAKQAADLKELQKQFNDALHKVFYVNKPEMTVLISLRRPSAVC